MILPTVQLGEQFFQGRDEADARELEQDLKQAIASAIISGDKRLWIFCNVNRKVVNLALNNIDKKALKQHQLELKVYNPQLSTLKPGVSDEISLRWQAAHEDIPTKIVDVEIETKKVYVIE